MTTQHLELRGLRIKEDAEGNICLTDLWHLAGKPSSKTTTNWRRLPTTGELVEALCQNLRKSLVKPKATADSVVYAKSGKGGGTYAHPILALAYAEYLNADLAVEVKDTYLRFRSGDITLVDEVLAKADAAKNFNTTRDLAKQARELFENTLSDHGVESGWQMGYVTNAIYVVLLGGKKADVAERRNLPAKNFRDHLTLEENIQTMGTEVMASGRIKDEKRNGHLECYDATARAATFIKEAFEKERADRKPR